MSKVLDLKQRKGELVTQERGVLDSVVDKKMTAEQSSQLEQIATDVRGVDLQIEAELRQEASRAVEADKLRQKEDVKERSLNEKDMSALRSKVFESYIRGRGVDTLTEDERSIYKEAMARGQEKATDSKGGFLTPTIFSNQVIETIAAYGGMLENANVITTSDGNTMNMPTFDDTANVASIIGEAVVATEEEMAFGRTSIGAYKYKSGVFAISNELLTDSNVAVIPLITKATGARFQRAWNLHFTKGTNSGQPQGIVPGLIAAGGTTSIAATALAADNLIDLVHSLNAAYRFGSKFMLNDVTLSAIRKLKDGDGNYLWQMGDISKGVPDTLLGYPVAVNYDMDGIATSKVSVLFGNYTSAYTIRRAGEFALRRSEEFKFDSDEVAFVSFARVDGKLLLPAAVKGLQHA